MRNDLNASLLLDEPATTPRRGGPFSPPRSVSSTPSAAARQRQPLDQSPSSSVLTPPCSLERCACLLFGFLESSVPLVAVPGTLLASTALLALRQDGYLPSLSLLQIAGPTYIALAGVLALLLVTLCVRHAPRGSPFRAAYRASDGPIRRTCCAGLLGRRLVAAYALAFAAALAFVAAVALLQFKLEDADRATSIADWSWSWVSLPLWLLFGAPLLMVAAGCGPSSRDPEDCGDVDEGESANADDLVMSESLAPSARQSAAELEADAADAASSQRLRLSLCAITLPPLVCAVLLVVRQSGAAPSVQLRHALIPLWVCDALLFCSACFSACGRLWRPRPSLVDGAAAAATSTATSGTSGASTRCWKLFSAVLGLLNVAALAAFKALLVAWDEDASRRWALVDVMTPLWMVLACALLAGAAAARSACASFVSRLDAQAAL
jgi:hypothetical protein